MAKIYETKEDFQRDKFKEQIHRLDNQAHAQDSTSWALLMGSVLADVWNMTKQRSSTALSFVSGALLITAVVQWFKSWRTHGKSHDLSLQLERMGPETIVLAPGMVMGEPPTPEKECTSCKHKKYGQGITPKTLADYAEKPTPEQGKVI